MTARDRVGEAIFGDTWKFRVSGSTADQRVDEVMAALIDPEDSEEKLPTNQRHIHMTANGYWEDEDTEFDPPELGGEG